MARSILPIAAVLALGLLSAPPATADTVTLRPASGDGPDYEVTGAIVDLTGRLLTIESPGGRKKSYPADRLVQLATNWPPARAAALRLLEEKRWADAMEKFLAASRSDKRGWVRRQMLEGVLRCRLALGQIKPAGDVLIALDAADPATPAWRLAPLPWFAANDLGLPDAKAWLARREESARLLGAAWLLTTPEQATAVGQLRSLARSQRQTIALLAETQLWRLSLARADARQADRWAAWLMAVPESLRAGPQHVLAQAYLRQKRYDEAALAALEGPLTGNAPHRLAARSLLLAGRALSKAGRGAEAARLLQEVARDYADTPQRQDAEALLRP